MTTDTILLQAIYFATSSDSGSLVVDYLASNGRLHHHWVQRLFWALTEGKYIVYLNCMTRLIDELFSFQGLWQLLYYRQVDRLPSVPFRLLQSYLDCRLFSCYATSCNLFICSPIKPPIQEVAKSKRTRIQLTKVSLIRLISPSLTFLVVTAEFPHPIFGGVFNVMEYALSLGNVHEDRVSRGMGWATQEHITEFMKGLFIPFIPFRQILQAAYPKNVMTNNLVAGSYGVLYYGWISIFIALSTHKGLKGIGWTFFFAAAMILMSVRFGFRTNFNVRSNPIGDFISSLFFWPQVFSQMRAYCEEHSLAQRAEEKYA